MKPRPEGAWTPSAMLLAAYADGEFEGRDDLSPLRQRVEDWLTAHPEEQVELAAYRRLRQAALDTTPAEPSQEAWDRVLLGIQAGQARSTPGRGSRSWWPMLAAAAACIALVGVLWAPRERALIPDNVLTEQDESVFPVASASEVAILRVEGADAGTLVVGELPLQGPLELVGPGEVTLTSVQPDARDNMVPHFVSGSSRPMFWARLDSD